MDHKNISLDSREAFTPTQCLCTTDVVCEECQYYNELDAIDKGDEEDLVLEANYEDYDDEAFQRECDDAANEASFDDYDRWQDDGRYDN